MRLRALVILTAGLVCLAAGGAAASPVASVTNVEWQGDTLVIDVLAQSVPLGTPPEGITAAVTLRGERVEANVTSDAVASDAATSGQTVMLVLDASGSMAGTGQQQATRATQTFLSDAPPSIPVGLISFSRKAALLSPPTLDRGKLVTDVLSVRPSGDTALYDAIALALRTVGTEPCTIVVLSDGKDTTSALAKTGAQAQLAASPCITHFIGLRTSAAEFKTLQELARSGRGLAFRASDSSGIASVFSQSVQTGNLNLRLTATFPSGTQGAGGAAGMEITIGEAKLGATTPTPAVSAREAAAADPLLLAAGILMFYGILLVFWYSSEGSDRARKRRLEHLIATYAVQVKMAEPERDDTLLESLEDLIHPILERRGRAERIEVMLDGAGIARSPEQWVLIHVASALGAGLLFFLLSGGAVVDFIIGAPLGAIAPYAWAKRQRATRGKRFEAALPDALVLMASSLRSGFSLDQAIAAAAEQSQGDVSRELRRAVQEIRIGSSLEAALERVADRMASNDFRWVVTALRIQRKSGGNLAQLLMTVAQTVRQRGQILGEVRALTAEGRLSAYVLIGLPIGLFLFLMVTQPEYLAPLYQTSIGLMISGFGLVMLAVGWIIMQRIVRVDV